MPSDTGPQTRVLLVEDEEMIAMLMEDMLSEFECEVAGIASTIDQALAMAEAESFDVAFLDVNLNRVPVYPVADVLRRRGIPFAFVTGYGSVGIDAGYANSPVLQKPFQSQELADTLGRLRGRRIG